MQHHKKRAGKYSAIICGIFAVFIFEFIAAIFAALVPPLQGRIYGSTSLKKHNKITAGLPRRARRYLFYCKFGNYFTVKQHLIYRNMQFKSVALFNNEHYEYRGGQRYYHAEAYIYAHKAGGSAVYARRDIVYHAGYIAE